MSDGRIILGVGIFVLATMALVFTQHLCPEHLRPLSIAKSCFVALWEAVRRCFKGLGVAAGKLWQISKEQMDGHRELVQKREAAAREDRQKRAEWQARPCAMCGWKGQFRLVQEKKLVKKKSAATAIAEVAIIIFILAPITCGLGLILLFFIGGGDKFETLTSQQCPDCGAVRPL